MSLTRTVPASVPFDFHSSRPWTPSLAVKKTSPPTSVRESGLLGRVCGSLHCDWGAPALRAAFLRGSALSAGDVAAAVDAPTPIRVTAAAIAAARLAPAPRARRRSTLAHATRDRRALSLAERLRRLTT